MFFIIGITGGRKDLRFNQMVICSRCGRYGRYEVYMTYTALSLFFIPCFKWNKEYFVRMSCCGTVYRLDPEVGRRIARGEDLEIQPADLQPVQAGPYDPYGQNGWGSQEKRCPNCGYTAQGDFAFCPKCGHRF